MSNCSTATSELHDIHSIGSKLIDENRWTS